MKRCVKCHSHFVDADWRCDVCGHSPELSNGLLLFAPDSAWSSEDFDPRAFVDLAARENGSFWFRSRKQLIVRKLQDLFSGMSKFLEVGCGSGYVLSAVAEAFPAAKLAGSDMFAEGLAFARSRVPSSFLFQADSRHLPFDEEFDVIGAFDLLEHVTDDTGLLGEMFRATRPGGGIVLTVPQHPFLWSEADRFARHKRRYRRRELVQKVEAVGFEVIDQTSFVSLLLPLLAAARIYSRLRRGRFDPWAELELPAPIDRILESIMRLELAMIRRSIVFPMGGSLLVAARKPEAGPA